MIKIILYVLIFLQSSNIYDQTEEVIKKNIPEQTELKKLKFNLEKNIKSEIESSSQQKFFKDELTYWKIYIGRKIVNYAFLDNVYGKSLPITFLVILNTDGTVNKVEIIKYREQYGSGVSNINWLNQFINFNSSSDYSSGKGIQGISGATISVNSVSKGVKKIVKLFEKIKNEL